MNAHYTLKGLLAELPTLTPEEKWVLQTVLDIGAERQVAHTGPQHAVPAAFQIFAEPTVPAGPAPGYGALRMPPYRLTARELEVLKNLMSGHSNKETAIELGISPRTVELHRAHIMEKLGTRSAIQLVDTVRSITGRDTGNYA